MLEFRLLGPVEVLRENVPLPLVGRNQRAVLAFLLLHANEVVSTERLVDALWGERPPRTATASLQNAVSQLRKLLGPGALHRRANGYVLEFPPEQLDLARFQALVRRARAAEPAERAVVLREALDLWRGPPLADLEHETFLQGDIQRLEGLRLGAVEERIDAELELRPDGELVAELESLVRDHPVRERLRAQLMLALYRTGRQAEALAVYHDARRTLVDELGIEPGPELQALYGSILRQERSLVRVEAPPLNDHFDEVLRALTAGRLVPVLGPAAGVVTAKELARLLAERFELDSADRGLAYVCQAVAARHGNGALHDELHEVLRPEVEPAPLHRWLARLPPLLRARSLPQQVIVTTSLDDAIERAFAETSEPLDVAAYVAAGRDRGKFLHILPGGDAAVVHEPNTYAGFALDERPVVLKVHGHSGAAPSRELESFVVCEDDHIDYLAGDAGAVPVQLAARLRRSHLLFVGYGIDDWSLRVFLRRVWGGDRLAYRAWAVQPAAPVHAGELWRERGADVYEVSLDTYAERLARLTGTLAEEPAA
ncbi:MAG TPA: BTAD domain-containing putative transcriptional regulator [Gaiellaceae bacterium]|nr:BTAD domain-containing putative transcriptional regulator [Gaiellaceae bacterium]